MTDTAKEAAREIDKKLRGIAKDCGNYDGNPKPHCHQCGHDEAAILDAADSLQSVCAEIITRVVLEPEREKLAKLIKAAENHLNNPRSTGRLLRAALEEVSHG